MKYYIGYPISFNCNLRCSYCYNMDFFNYKDGKTFEKKWHDKRTFTFEEYENWRDKFLYDAEKIILHLYGGEPFCLENVEDVFEILNLVNFEKVDILTNGIGDELNYKRLEKYKHKINRIGFTFHRKILQDNLVLKKRYENNVLIVNNLGIKIYVKELLIKRYRENILAYKKYWQDLGIDFKIQDFKGEDKGFSHEEYNEYSPLDHLLIDWEYKHPENTCSCMKGYKNLFIRGYDMADIYPSGGDIIACWHDPTVIGNIKESWFNPNYKITKSSNGYDVKVIQKIYRGTYEKDLYISNYKK